MNVESRLDHLMSSVLSLRHCQDLFRITKGDTCEIKETSEEQETVKESLHLLFQSNKNKGY